MDEGRGDGVRIGLCSRPGSIKARVDRWGQGSYRKNWSYSRGRDEVGGDRMGNGVGGHVGHGTHWLWG